MKIDDDALVGPTILFICLLLILGIPIVAAWLEKVYFPWVEGLF